MDDLRWFAPNRYCCLPVEPLRERGLRIATAGNGPARLVMAADGASVVEAYRYAAPRGLPMVVYLWDLPPWQVAGTASPVVGVGGRLFKIPRPWGGYAGRNGYHSRVRHVARQAREVWTPSCATQADVARHFGVDSVHLPFCYDSVRFHGGVSRAPLMPPEVLCISRLVEYKNHAAVLRAAARVSPVPRVRIIGRGPEAGKLIALASSLSVTLRLDDHWQSDDAILAAYRRASVVVSMSRFEGLGLTPLEGIAMGIPTVASDIPSHREFASKSATLVPLDDDEALAAAVDGALRRGGHREPADADVAALTIASCAERMLPRFERLLRT